MLLRTLIIALGLVTIAPAGLVMAATGVPPEVFTLAPLPYTPAAREPLLDQQTQAILRGHDSKNQTALRAVERSRPACRT